MIITHPFCLAVILYPLLGVIVDSVSWQPVWLVVALIQVAGWYMLDKLLPRLYSNAGEEQTGDTHAAIGDLGDIDLERMESSHVEQPDNSVDIEFSQMDK